MDIQEKLYDIARQAKSVDKKLKLPTDSYVKQLNRQMLEFTQREILEVIESYEGAMINSLAYFKKIVENKMERKIQLTNRQNRIMGGYPDEDYIEEDFSQ
jgi:hypothetical protein